MGDAGLNSSQEPKSHAKYSMSMGKTVNYFTAVKEDTFEKRERVPKIAGRRQVSQKTLLETQEKQDHRWRINSEVQLNASFV